MYFLNIQSLTHSHLEMAFNLTVHPFETCLPHTQATVPQDIRKQNTIQDRSGLFSLAP